MEQDTGQTLYIIRYTGQQKLVEIRTRGSSPAATALLLLLLLGVWKDRLIGVQWCFKQPRSAGKQISYSEYPPVFFGGGEAEFWFCFVVSVYVTQSFSYTILAKKRRTQCSVAPIGWPFFVQPLEDECQRGRNIGKKTHY